MQRQRASPAIRSNSGSAAIGHKETCPPESSQATTAACCAPRFAVVSSPGKLRCGTSGTPSATPSLKHSTLRANHSSRSDTLTSASGTAFATRRDTASTLLLLPGMCVIVYSCSSRIIRHRVTLLLAVALLM